MGSVHTSGCRAKLKQPSPAATPRSQISPRFSVFQISPPLTSPLPTVSTLKVFYQ